LYCHGGIEPSRMVSIVSSISGSLVDRLSSRRPSSTSFRTGHDTGATLEYHGHSVSLL
jgi:hypothetical protein